MHVYAVPFRDGVIVICNRNRLQSITVFHVIVIVIDCSAIFYEVIVIVIDYTLNVIVILITFAITLVRSQYMYTYKVNNNQDFFTLTCTGHVLALSLAGVLPDGPRK